MANLRLDDTEGLFVDRGGYGIIIPGDSAHSKMYLKISNPNEAMRMPPTYSGGKTCPHRLRQSRLGSIQAQNGKRTGPTRRRSGQTFRRCRMRNGPAIPSIISSSPGSKRKG